jgi:hypothetical protein
MTDAHNEAAREWVQNPRKSCGSEEKIIRSLASLLRRTHAQGMERAAELIVPDGNPTVAKDLIRAHADAIRAEASGGKP